jgi:multisubunit Na+/H+ antiporter MnhB subunit
MNAPLTFDLALAALILAVGGWILAIRDHCAAVIGFIVYGLLLTIAWVRLAAVDVALTEAAIGGGMTGMLLLSAVARLGPADPNPAQTSASVRFGAAIPCALISAGLAYAVLVPPDVAPSLAPLVMENLAQSGLGNPVAGVLFVYRALDTLLEKVVLLLALVGVWSLASDRMWPGVPGLRVYAHPSDTLDFLGQLLTPIAVMFGVYMCWIGATMPGGAFQGGTVLAAVWLLVMIAGLKRVPSINHFALRLLLVVGPALFVGIGLAGFAFAGGFLAYPPDHAKLLIVTIEVALTLSIGATLALLAAGPPERVRQP